MTTRWWYKPELWAAWLWRIATSPLLGWIPVIAVMLMTMVYGLFKIGFLTFVFVGLAIAAGVLNLCTLVAASLAGRRPCWLSIVGGFVMVLIIRVVWPEALGHGLGGIYWVGFLALGFPTNLVSFLLPWVTLNLPEQLAVAVFALALAGLSYLQAFVLLPLLFRWRGRYSPAVDTAGKTTRLRDPRGKDE